MNRVFLLLFITLTQAAECMELTNIDNLIEKIWILNKEIVSPWNSTIMPVFMDYTNDSNKVILRGYGKNSEQSYTYRIEEARILIGVKLNLVIKVLNDTSLIVMYDGLEYKYYPLKKSKRTINSEKLLQVLTQSGKWNWLNKTLEFKDEIEKVYEIRKFYKIIEFRNSKLFYGNFYIDNYCNEVFLITLIDGKYIEDIYQIVSVQDNEVEFLYLNSYDKVSKGTLK